MPEGPQLRITADRLREILQDRTILKMNSRMKKSVPEKWNDHVAGQTVTSVHSHGKNLFIALSNGYTIYSHMMMWGSWHVYKLGEEWRKEAKKARMELYTDENVAVLFSAPVCELLPPDALELHRTSQLGPDLLNPDTFDEKEVRRRFRLEPNRDKEIGAVIMDQYVVAGIGNILKSEILFFAGIHPQRTAASLTPIEFKNLMRISRELMEKSYVTKGFRKVFLPAEMERIGGRLGYTYRRTHYPCYVCGTPIKMIRQGMGNRTTYFCPACQPEEGRGKLLHRRRITVTAEILHEAKLKQEERKKKGYGKTDARSRRRVFQKADS